MTLEITVARSARDVRRFVDFPWALYDHARFPNWIPPLRKMVRDVLDRGKPFYRDAERELFLVLRDGVIVGRIAAIENRAHNRFHNDRVGFWGFFECVDDHEAANALFASVRAWLAARGLDVMRGPVMPSTNYDCGMMVSGFEHEPAFMTPWNPAYYAALVEGAGQAKAKDLVAHHIPFEDPDWKLPERFSAFVERFRRNSRMTLRSLDLSRWDEELDLCWELYNASWENNWGFIPMAREEFLSMARDLKPLLRPEFAFMVAVEGVPAGFVLVLPDYNQVLKHNRSGKLLPFGAIRMLFGKNRLRHSRVFALGVKPEFRTRGIYPFFVTEAYRRLRETGALYSELSWVLEDNEALLGPLRAAGMLEMKRWRIYDGPTSA